MYGGEPPNSVFSAFSFIGFLLVLVPFRWHLECMFSGVLRLLQVSDIPIAAWNTGTCLYMMWAGLGSLNSFINSIAWNKTVMDKAPVWCDICKLLAS